MNLNHCTLSGNLTRDPEIRTVAGERMVAQFTLAQNRKWKTPDGEPREEVLFIDAEAWGRTAELIGQYLVKGSPTVVEGRMKLDTWQDKEGGGKRSKIKLVVDQVHLLPRRQAEDSIPGEGGNEDLPEEAARPVPTASRAIPRPTSAGPRPRPAAALHEAPPF